MYNSSINGYIEAFFNPDADFLRIDGKYYKSYYCEEREGDIWRAIMIDAQLENSLQIECEGRMVIGRKLGLWKYYHRNGTLRLEAEYSLNDRNFGEVPIGTLDSAAYLCWNFTFKDGIWREYDANGKIIKDLFYKHNVLQKG